MVCEYTLKVRNFPPNLSDAEKEDLLRHFGAANVKVITSKVKRKSVAFARFDSKELARNVLHRLHQAKVLDTYLYVEYANKQVAFADRTKPKDIECDDYKGRKHYRNFVTKLHAFNASFHQPPPSNLRYAYPLPNRATINNIGHALASVPKFYTQVLHLMNRMNLPPPFADVVAAAQNVVTPPEIEADVVAPSEIESESELESDDDDRGKNMDVIPVKRHRAQKKGVKRPKFIKPNAITIVRQPKIGTDQVFERSELQSTRKIEVKVPVDCLERKADDVPTTTTVSLKEETIIKTGRISDEELKSNRVATKDLSVFPVFRDYHPGAPSSRLYIKNIAKTAEKTDLEYIYGRYASGGEDGVFDVRLMQEGRMKGQAFVTLDSVETAQKALQDTNGYILKDKPLVVVFARSIVPKV